MSVAKIKEEEGTCSCAEQTSELGDEVEGVWGGNNVGYSSEWTKVIHGVDYRE